MKALAASKNITLPDTISNRQLKEKTKLQKLKGNAFDVAYLNMMVVDHKKDINEFEKETSRGTDPDIKSFALDNLRILHKHLDSATTIQKLVTPKKIVIEEPIYP